MSKYHSRRPPLGEAASPDLNSLAIHRLFDGRIETAGTFQNAASVGTTTVSDRSVVVDDFVFVIPLDANAYTKMNEASFYIPRVTQSDADNGQFTVNHSSTATQGNFGYLIIGD